MYNSKDIVGLGRIGYVDHLQTHNGVTKAGCKDCQRRRPHKVRADCMGG